MTEEGRATDMNEAIAARSSTGKNLRIVRQALGGNVDRAFIKRVVGVSLRTWRRWSTGQGEPSSTNAKRLLTVAGAAKRLYRSYTHEGVVVWFTRPHPQLDYMQPVQLLDDADRHADVLRAAAGSLDQIAT